MQSIQLREWETITFAENPDLAGFSFEGDLPTLAVLEALKQNNMLEVLELRRGLSIQSTSYVGRVQLGDLQITIQPKIKMNVLLTLFRYAYNLRDLRLTRDTAFDTEPDTFQDILIAQLIAEVSELISRGLHRQYKRVEERLAVPKGQIDLLKIARRGGMIEAHIPVIYHPRLEDNLINQVVLSGLYLAATITSDLLLRSRLRQLAGIMEEHIARIQLDSSTLTRLRNQMSRITTHYESSITLIEMLMLSLGVTLNTQTERILLSGFLFNMNDFFERLVSRFLNENLPGYTIHDQHQLTGMMTYDPSHNPKRRQSPTPRPDFAILKENQVVSILDAKYRDLWEKTLPRDMLYQLAIYALSQGWDGQSTILYPAIDNAPKPQIINIQEIKASSNKAQVILKAVNLNELSILLQDDGPRARRKRVELAEYLVFGTSVKV